MQPSVKRRFVPVHDGPSCPLAYFARKNNARPTASAAPPPAKSERAKGYNRRYVAIKRDATTFEPAREKKRNWPRRVAITTREERLGKKRSGPYDCRLGNAMHTRMHNPTRLISRPMQVGQRCETLDSGKTGRTTHGGPRPFAASSRSRNKSMRKC